MQFLFLLGHILPDYVKREYVFRPYDFRDVYIFMVYTYTYISFHPFLINAPTPKLTTPMLIVKLREIMN